MDDVLEVDRSCWSATFSTQETRTYERTGLDTVLASLYSRQGVVSIRVTVSVEFRPRHQFHSLRNPEDSPSDSIIIVDASLFHSPDCKTNKQEDDKSRSNTDTDNSADWDRQATIILLLFYCGR